MDKCDYTFAVTLCITLLYVISAQTSTTEPLIVRNNSIYKSISNIVWTGKGVNLFDTRACGASKRSKQEVIRRIDHLFDKLNLDWIRLNLEANTVNKNALNDSSYWNDIKDIVAQVGLKPGKYVEVSVWKDTSLCDKDSGSSCNGDRMLPGGPSNNTSDLWAFMAKYFKDKPHVIMGIVNEPENTTTPQSTSYLYRSMNSTVQKIRNTGAKNVILVQCLWYSIDCSLYVNNPITAGGGINIAYEIHLYSSINRTNQLLALPNMPLVVSETAVINDVKNSIFATVADYMYTVNSCKKRDIPYAGWAFDEECYPPMLAKGDNLSAYTAWGKLFLTGEMCSDMYCEIQQKVTFFAMYPSTFLPIVSAPAAALAPIKD
jgi:Cellulase (glycosyl hydrolase family 5)